MFARSLMHTAQGDSGDATDDEMVSRKTRSCKEALYRNGPESESVDQEDPGSISLKFFNESKSSKIHIIERNCHLHSGFHSPFF